MRTGPALFTCALVAFPLQLLAQDARLQGRLDPRTSSEVQQVLDSARRLGLPIEPLMDKALEGAAKRAEGDRIVSAVRTLAGGLRTARASLGPSSGEADLVAGAEALRAGVSSQALAELRASRGPQSVLTPLAVLSDLISRGVPADTAEAAVLRLAEQGASDADFGTLQQEVEHDIRAGASPSAAASVRAGGEAGGEPGGPQGSPPDRPAAHGHGSPQGADDHPSAQGPPNDRPPKDRPPKDRPPKDRPPKDKAPHDKAPKDKPPKDHSSHGNPAIKP
jgi:hypothetical protein